MVPGQRLSASPPSGEEGSGARGREDRTPRSRVFRKAGAVWPGGAAGAGKGAGPGLGRLLQATGSWGQGLDQRRVGAETRPQPPP